MKLIMENWRQYTVEEQVRKEILNYLNENNIVLTEEEIAEAMPGWLKKAGKNAALIAALSGAGAPVANAGVSDWIQNARDQIVNVVNPESGASETEAPSEGLAEDGTFTAKYQVTSNQQLSITMADSDALQGLRDAGGGEGTVTSRAMVDGYVYSTASPAQ
jgi:hypothetical protein